MAFDTIGLCIGVLLIALGSLGFFMGVLGGRSAVQDARYGGRK